MRTSSYKPMSGLLFPSVLEVFLELHLWNKTWALSCHRIVPGTIWYLTASFSSWPFVKSNLSHQLLLFRFPMSFVSDTPMLIPVVIRLNFGASLLINFIFPVPSLAKSNCFSLKLSKPSMASLRKARCLSWFFCLFVYCLEQSRANLNRHLLRKFCPDLSVFNHSYAVNLWIYQNSSVLESCKIGQFSEKMDYFFHLIKI